jgi:hypothetical protein
MADVTVDSAVSTSSVRSFRSVVFTTADIGYRFFIDGDGTFVYSKTTDGGASWGTPVVVHSATTQCAFDVWYDKWTPGNTGSLIHMVYFDTTNDDVFYRTLDPASSDTLGTLRTAFNGATAVAGAANFCSVTVTRSGYIYVAYDIDNGTEKGLIRSTDSGANWSANLSTTFVEVNPDFACLFPASGTGDDNDCWAVYFDASVNEVTLKLWDSSAGSATESTNIVTVAEAGTDINYQFPVSAAVRHSDGHLILVAHNALNTATADSRVFNITSTSTFAELAALATDVDATYYSSIFIDQSTDDLYIAYGGKTDDTETRALCKVYYAKSTDDGANWTKDNAYMEGATTSVTQIAAPLMGDRFYVTWRHGNTQIAGNKVNSVTMSSLTAVQNDSTLQWAMIAGVFNSSDLRWNLIAAIEQSSDLRWALLNAATNDSTLMWALIAAAANDLDLRWQMEGSVTSDSDLRWNLLNSLTNDSDLRWSLVNAAQNDTDLRWALLQAAQADSDLRWSLIAAVLNDSDLRWALLQSLQQDSDLRWALLQSAEQNSDLRWSMIAAVLNDSDLRWGILSAVLSDSDLRWNLLAAVANDSTLQWNVISEGTVSNTLEMRWALLQALQSDLDVRWNLANAVQMDSDLRWAMLQSQQQDIDLRWSLVQAVVQSVEAQWSLLTSVGVTADMRWALVQAVVNDAELRWNVDALSAVLRDFDLRWRVEGSLDSVEGSLHLYWAVNPGLSVDFFLVVEEGRVYVVTGGGARQFVVPAENRTYTVPAEDRVLIA